MPLEVNTCCFCVSLRSGSLIIGYLSAILNFIYIGVLIAGMVGAGEVASETTDPNTKAAAELALGLLGLGLILIFINLLFTIFLLVGIHKHKRGLIKAYLIFTCIFIVFAIVQFFIGIAKWSDARVLIQNLISILFSIYYMVVVRSYYLKMDYEHPVLQA